jgi:hypothetical protein
VPITLIERSTWSGSCESINRNAVIVATFIPSYRFQRSAACLSEGLELRHVRADVPLVPEMALGTNREPFYLRAFERPYTLCWRMLLFISRNPCEVGRSKEKPIQT